MALARTTTPSTETSISHRMLVVRESGAGMAPAAALAAALTAAALTVSDSFAVAVSAAATAVWTSTCGTGGICDRFSPIDPGPWGDHSGFRGLRRALSSGWQRVTFGRSDAS